MLDSLSLYAYPYSEKDETVFAPSSVVTVDSLSSLADVLRPILPLVDRTPSVIDFSSPQAQDAPLAGKRILVVEDDVRNVFALTNALENEGMTVLFAENGREALDVLYRNPDVDLILMDIMMPGLDGYETTQAIRSRPQFVSLPIIALTAKAMKGDREKCLEFGASDYIAKPIDMEELLAVLRAQLS